ncbi:hypothetical protein IH601_01680 [Candidatus Bipolaricaulota bacterium]|nr:hypothetical protein [Candidatus Bipolaricaulota bacterium]
MKKISKILSMVIVVGLIAAIPASTQILTGSRVASSDESNLALLILVNRLELSEEQMDALDDILTGLIGQKDEWEGLAAEFEQAMIEFNGTGEELDAMLVTFREGQLASAEALRESIGVSLDEVRDLLSINQGLVLQEVFPQLLGSALLGTDYCNRRLQGAAPMVESHMPSTSMGRGSSRMSQQSPRGERMAGRTREDVETMIAQRLGQVLDNEAMSTQVEGRLERLGNQVPEQMIERFGEASGKFGAQMEQGVDTRNIETRGDLRQPGAASFLMRREQSVRDESWDLFGWLEQIANVLELKLEAMK